MTPTKRSLKYLRDQGYTVAIVEKWNPHVKVRQDLFGFGDLLCVKASVRGAMIVQCCTGSSFAARLDKIRNEARAGIWLAAGNSIVIHGWRKVGARGKRKLWEVRDHVVGPESIADSQSPIAAQAR
jgi:hypothetical protein